jgi:hypothetical protein
MDVKVESAPNKQNHQIYLVVSMSPRYAVCELVLNLLAQVGICL